MACSETSGRRTRMHGAAAPSLLEVSEEEARERLAQLGEELAIHGAVLQLAGEAAAGGTASAAIRGICERALLSGVRLLSRLRARLKVVLRANGLVRRLGQTGQGASCSWRDGGSQARRRSRGESKARTAAAAAPPRAGGATSG